MPDGEIEGNFSHGFSVILNSTQSVERGQNRVTNAQTGLPKKGLLAKTAEKRGKS